MSCPIAGAVCHLGLPAMPRPSNAWCLSAFVLRCLQGVQVFQPLLCVVCKVCKCPIHCLVLSARCAGVPDIALCLQGFHPLPCVVCKVCKCPIYCIVLCARCAGVSFIALCCLQGVHVSSITLYYLQSVQVSHLLPCVVCKVCRCPIHCLVLSARFACDLPSACCFQKCVVVLSGP